MIYRIVCVHASHSEGLMRRRNLILMQRCRRSRHTSELTRHSVAIERPLLGNKQMMVNMLGVPSVQEFAKLRAALPTGTSANAHNKNNRGGHISGCACYR